MAKTKEYTRWAIVGEVGLYVGQYLTRKDAISDHIRARYGVAGTWQRGLSAGQLQLWRKMQAKGDRAVKVRIIVPVGKSVGQPR